jgi:phage tail sheath protein FI
MTLSMRNDIITYEMDFLNSLKARGALVGSPVVEFRPDENSTADLQQGKFVWSIAATPTIPAKYIKAEVAYTSAGLSAYIEGE